VNVSCPECSSLFRVDPAKVPFGGVQARCSVCGGIIAVPGGPDEVTAVTERSATLAAPSAPVSAFDIVEPPRMIAPVTRSSAELARPSAEVARRSAEVPISRPDRPTPLVAPALSTRTPESAPRLRTESPADQGNVLPTTPSTETTPPPSSPTPRATMPGFAAPTLPAEAVGGAALRPTGMFTVPPAPEPRQAIPPVVPPPSRSSVPAPTVPSRSTAPSPTLLPPRPSSPIATPRAPLAPPPASPIAMRGGVTPLSSPAAGGGAESPKRHQNPFLSNDPNVKARRLARALVSDMIAYLPQKRDEGLREGTLKQLFREEIKKSYEEYVEQVGKPLAESTQHFQEALNDILAGGRRLF
jgi:predicted Zn finger-like uncharacterized protein